MSADSNDYQEMQQQVESSNDYLEVYPAETSLQEAPIPTTLDSKQLQDYVDQSFDSRNVVVRDEQSAYVSMPNYRSSDESLSMSHGLGSQPSRLLIK